MILFNRFTHENLDKINSLEENELEKAVQSYNEASEIISRHLSNSPNLLRKYPEISEAFREVNIGIKNARRLNSIKKHERERRERLREEQRLHDEEQRKQVEKAYWEYVQQERIKRRLQYGVPPKDAYSCPAEFPIRATANLDELDARGTYYYVDERSGVEVYWCFANAQDAEADDFRRPYKTPPKQQPR